MGFIPGKLYENKTTLAKTLAAPWNLTVWGICQGTKTTIFGTTVEHWHKLMDLADKIFHKALLCGCNSLSFRQIQFRTQIISMHKSQERVPHVSAGVKINTKSYLALMHNRKEWLKMLLHKKETLLTLTRAVREDSRTSASNMIICMGRAQGLIESWLS